MMICDLRGRSTKDLKDLRNNWEQVFRQLPRLPYPTGTDILLLKSIDEIDKILDERKQACQSS